MSKQCKAEILSRIYLKNPRPADCFNLAIEIITNYQDVPDKDCVRLIDLNSGEVFIESEYFADAQEIIDYASKLYSSHDRIYKTGWTRCDKPKKELRTFSDLPIKDQIRHIQSHARDLEHDMHTEYGKHIKNPVLQATQDMQMYDVPCFYKLENGDWELDPDCDFV